jgi:rhodanese-related sulfurtransferase
MRYIYSILAVFILLVGVVGFQKVVAFSDETARISLAEAKKDFDEGKAVFVDTRNEAAYKEKHIKGAINFTLADVEARWNEIPTDKKIIVYCS